MAFKITIDHTQMASSDQTMDSLPPDCKGDPSNYHQASIVRKTKEKGLGYLRVIFQHAVAVDSTSSLCFTASERMKQAASRKVKEKELVHTAAIGIRTKIHAFLSPQWQSNPLLLLDVGKKSKQNTIQQILELTNPLHLAESNS